MPTAPSTSASTAKRPSSDAMSRGRATEPPTTSSSVVMRVMVCSGFTDQMA